MKIQYTTILKIIAYIIKIILSGKNSNTAISSAATHFNLSKSTVKNIFENINCYNFSYIINILPISGNFILSDY